MPGNDLSDMYYSIPRLTRYWFTATIIFSLIGKLGLVDIYSLLLSWEPFFYKFQLWRPITALFYFPITPNTGFHFLINLYFLYSYSSRLETGVFGGREAEYAFMFLLNWITLIFLGFLLEFPLLFEPMVLSVMYVWCQLNKDTIVQFWFGSQFKAIYFPWALVLFNLIIRGSALMELVGIFVGHVYYFFMHQYPHEYGGRRLFTVPGFLYRIFPNARGTVSGFGVPPQQRAAEIDRNRGFPGRGHVLGRAE